MMAKRGILTVVVLAACTFMAPGLTTVSTATTSPSSTTFTGAFVPNKLGAASTMESGFKSAGQAVWYHRRWLASIFACLRGSVSPRANWAWKPALLQGLQAPARKAACPMP